MTAAQLLAMSDNELGNHASGGYGARKRNEFYASLRAALEVAARAEIKVSPATASEQGGVGISSGSRGG